MEKYRILTKTPTIPRLDEKTILQKALLVTMRRMVTRTRLRRSPKLRKSNQDATHLTRVTIQRMVTRKSFCRVRQVNEPENQFHKQFQQGFEFAEKR